MPLVFRWLRVGIVEEEVHVLHEDDAGLHAASVLEYGDGIFDGGGAPAVVVAIGDLIEALGGVPDVEGAVELLGGVFEEVDGAGLFVGDEDEAGVTGADAVVEDLHGVGGKTDFWTGLTGFQNFRITGGMGYQQSQTGWMLVR